MDSKLLLNMGKELLSNGKLREAIAVFEKAEAYPPETDSQDKPKLLDLYLPYTKGLLLFQKDECEPAFQQFEKVLNYEKKYKLSQYQTLYILGCLKSKTNQKSEAEAYLQQALELEPDFKKAKARLDALTKPNEAEKSAKPPEYDIIKLIARAQSSAEGLEITPEEDILEQISEIFYEKDLQGETSEETRLRSAINTWAVAIPNHDLTSLGDSIEIKTFKSFPAYYLELKSQYERRSLHVGSKPYYDEDIPNKTVNHENADIWKFKTAPILNFSSDSKDYEIPESHEVMVCGTCQGRGNVTCHTCKGLRTVTCYSCSGSGKQTCSSCTNGQTRCWSCNGTGKTESSEYINGQTVTKYAPCSSCGGRGYNPCSTCNATGYVTCYSCEGRGQVTCSSCGGKGIVTCGHCAGQGRVVEFLYFTDEFDAKTRGKLISHPTMPSDLLEKKGAPGKDKKKNKTSVSIKDLHNLLGIINICNKELNPEVFAELSHETLKKQAEDFILASKEETPLGPLSEDVKVLKQQTMVGQIEVLCATYLYSDKEYEVWLYGNTLNVYAEKSPISDLAEGYLIAAEGFYSKKDYSEAIDLYEKVIEMELEGLSKKATKMRKKALFKISMEYLAGTLIGVLPSVLLIPVITKFLHKAPNWIYTDVLALAGLIGLGVSIVVAGGFCSFAGVKIRLTKRRYQWPAFTSAILTLAVYIVYGTMR